ncbi:putative zinc finger Ran-binding domain-containing protein 2 [Trichinella spiralis]|uniref:putative zinc finger Ran-binding domain-containing protein 2 n=1 Tax=Trichinella spiralis TaxID=6334 RepID=UPI0001EFBFA2|nr:putative zinc finger Ran-binding domain-containing protein 2 [Trichinella spiralis]
MSIIHVRYNCTREINKFELSVRIFANMKTKRIQLGVLSYLLYFATCQYCNVLTTFQCRLFWSNSYINNNSSIIISHLDIQHGNTCAELEFPSPISSVIKRCHICKSASTTVSKSLRETFFECFKTQRAVIIPYILEKLASPRIMYREALFPRYSSNVKNPLVSLVEGRECTGIKGGDELERELLEGGDEMEGEMRWRGR